MLIYRHIIKKKKVVGTHISSIIHSVELKFDLNRICPNNVQLNAYEHLQKKKKTRVYLPIIYYTLQRFCFIIFIYTTSYLKRKRKRNFRNILQIGTNILSCLTLYSFLFILLLIIINISRLNHQ